MPRPERPLVVGLRGLAGAGKTTLAQILSSPSPIYTSYGQVPRFCPVSMAGPLKQGLALMGISKTTAPDLYRKFAQELGAACRAKNPDWWVEAAARNINAILTEGRNVIIDDVRYPNEARLCDLIFFIEPFGFSALDLGDRAQHESETWNLLKEGRIDATIENPKDNPLQAVEAMWHHIHLLRESWRAA